MLLQSLQAKLLVYGWIHCLNITSQIDRGFWETLWMLLIDVTDFSQNCSRVSHVRLKMWNDVGDGHLEQFTGRVDRGPTAGEQEPNRVLSILPHLLVHLEP